MMLILDFPEIWDRISKAGRLSPEKDLLEPLVFAIHSANLMNQSLIGNTVSVN